MTAEATRAERAVTVCNTRGLHARASARFVAEARAFSSVVTLSKDGEEVRADSIMELLMLAAGPGSRLVIRAEGEDAEAAVEALGALVECGFDETD
ncbi:MAG: HPr family phosphocarrier protein [Oceanicaulis sp.]